MTTSLKRPSLSKPKKGDPIPLHGLSFVRARNRNKAHSLLLSLFDKSGMTKKDLAVMLARKPEQITRWLGGPGNMTFDTFSDLLFAMTGSFAEIHPTDELSKGKSNHRAPTWLSMNSSSAETVPIQVKIADGSQNCIQLGWEGSSGGKGIYHEVGRSETGSEISARI